MTDPADLDIAAAGAALRAGKLTSYDLTRACLDRAAVRDAEVGAFVHLAGDEASAAARAADTLMAAGVDRGPLHGIPFAIKDVFDVAGWPVRFGCAHFRDRVATEHASVVARCLEAGAVPLGIVATYELATVGPDTTSLDPQPRNPWNKAHVTGGSSSGSAAAVAAGLVRFALGSDTGGSARSPAAYCGVAGFKPTAGVLDRAGLMPLAPSMDHVGILAASAADASLVFATLSDGLATTMPRTHRIAYGRGWCAGDGDEAAVQQLMDEAASVLSLGGSEIVLVDMPEYLAVEEAGANILLYEQVGSLWDQLEQDSGHVGRMAYASLKSGLNIADKDVIAARRAAAEFARDLDAILDGFDALILPTTMTIAPRFEAFEGGAPVWTAMRTIPFNLSGHPALTVPMGFHRGLPMGLQIIGARDADRLVLSIGAAFEAATDHSALRPYFA